jgi:hypothetical protein
VNLALLKARSEMARLPPKRAISLFDPGPRRIGPSESSSRIMVRAGWLIYPSEAVDKHA